MSTFVSLKIMKKLVLTHLLLNLYLLALIQPALPVLDYLINYDYIVSELCENRDKPILTCNGKCYLGDQITKQLDLQPDPEQPLPPKMDLEKFITLKGEAIPVLLAHPDWLVKSPFHQRVMKENRISNSLLRPPIV